MATGGAARVAPLGQPHTRLWRAAGRRALIWLFLKGIPRSLDMAQGFRPGPRKSGPRRAFGDALAACRPPPLGPRQLESNAGRAGSLSPGRAGPATSRQAPGSLWGCCPASR